ncbi:hypothetical protein BOTBODRAFT_192502 [Botryobasidium botryosum FD-172 SS1]|uniref:RING-type domain-containing protein n=1 Tax=Botryobasidium botryosum (strain FD-172 SS1) TaxID=930990 RepID=A0A067M6U1_BOTB1|nr:hypothetical protein BOTBODRAFT_192502 [Botryobasidium botryosum FD-172 SS1]
MSSHGEHRSPSARPSRDPYAFLRPPSPSGPSFHSARQPPSSSASSVGTGASASLSGRRPPSPHRASVPYGGEAPYLNHRIRHHGQVTLTPPENLGRTRVLSKAKKPSRQPPAPEASSSARPFQPSNGTSARRRVDSSLSIGRSISSDSLATRPTHISRLSGPIQPIARYPSAQSSPLAPFNDPTPILPFPSLPTPSTPPPSFEEAILSIPTTPSTPSVSQPRPTSPTPGNSDPENEVPSNVVHEDEGHCTSSWERDRRAGLSLEERVQREWARKKRLERFSVHVDQSTANSPPIQEEVHDDGVGELRHPADIGGSSGSEHIINSLIPHSQDLQLQSLPSTFRRPPNVPTLSLGAARSDNATNASAECGQPDMASRTPTAKGLQDLAPGLPTLAPEPQAAVTASSGRTLEGPAYGVSLSTHGQESGHSDTQMSRMLQFVTTAAEVGCQEADESTLGENKKPGDYPALASSVSGMHPPADTRIPLLSLSTSTKSPILGVNGTAGRPRALLTIPPLLPTPPVDPIREDRGAPRTPPMSGGSESTEPTPNPSSHGLASPPPSQPNVDILSDAISTTHVLAFESLAKPTTSADHKGKGKAIDISLSPALVPPSPSLRNTASPSHNCISHALSASTDSLQRPTPTNSSILPATFGSRRPPPPPPPLPIAQSVLPSTNKPPSTFVRDRIQSYETLTYRTPPPIPPKRNIGIRRPPPPIPPRGPGPGIAPLPNHTRPLVPLEPAQTENLEREGAHEVDELLKPAISSVVSGEEGGLPLPRSTVAPGGPRRAPAPSPSHKDSSQAQVWRDSWFGATPSSTSRRDSRNVSQPPSPAIESRGVAAPPLSFVGTPGPPAIPRDESDHPAELQRRDPLVATLPPPMASSTFPGTPFYNFPPPLPAPRGPRPLPRPPTIPPRPFSTVGPTPVPPPMLRGGPSSDGLLRRDASSPEPQPPSPIRPGASTDDGESSLLPLHTRSGASFTSNPSFAAPGDESLPNDPPLLPPSPNAAPISISAPEPASIPTPTYEYTDLDLLISRLEQAEPGSGTDYDDLLLLSSILGPGSAGSSDGHRQAMENLPVGCVEVERRRVLKDGRVKLKLSLLGIIVDRCSVCLSQFRDNQKGVLLPCKHSFHTKCAKSWLRTNQTCPVCRAPIDAAT